MHPLSSAQFVVTFALSITTTTLVSRFIYLVLRRWPLGIEKVAIANGASFVICWILFVVWCSTVAKIYWMAGHVAFAEDRPNGPEGAAQSRSESHHDAERQQRHQRADL